MDKEPIWRVYEQKKLKKGAFVKAFETEQELWDAACDYFEWAQENPLLEVKAFVHKTQGIIKEDIPKMRAMSWKEFALHAGVVECEMSNLNDPAHPFYSTYQAISQVIYNSKFTGAAAGLLNTHIIMRDLGLQEKTTIDHTSSDKSMTPKGNLDVSKLSDQALKELMDAMDSQDKTSE